MFDERPWPGPALARPVQIERFLGPGPARIQPGPRPLYNSAQAKPSRVLGLKIQAQALSSQAKPYLGLAWQASI